MPLGRLFRFLFPPAKQGTACSFCGKDSTKVFYTVAGPGNLAICSECTMICTDIIQEEYAKHLAKAHYVSLRIELASEYTSLSDAENRSVQSLLLECCAMSGEMQLRSFHFYSNAQSVDFLSVVVSMAEGRNVEEASKLMQRNWAALRQARQDVVAGPAGQQLEQAVLAASDALAAAIAASARGAGA